MYLASWSGGKDSCFACYKAIQSGYQVSHLVNFISQQYKRVSFHGTGQGLIQLQSKSVGIPVVQKETGPDDYEPVFKETVRSLMCPSDNSLSVIASDRRERGNLIRNGEIASSRHNVGTRNDQPRIKGMIFGDIYLQEHKQWVERICSELSRMESPEENRFGIPKQTLHKRVHSGGIKAYLPLWGMRTEDILAEFISSGFEAIIISAKASLIDKEWIGHKVNNNFIAYLKTKPLIDLSGEMGEYHTLVINGPLFKRKIEIKKSEVIEKETPYGKWRFLDIQEWA